MLIVVCLQEGLYITTKINELELQLSIWVNVKNIKKKQKRGQL